MLEIEIQAKNFKTSYVRKAGTIAKNEFGIFETMLFEKIRKSWSLKFGRTGVDLDKVSQSCV